MRPLTALAIVLTVSGAAFAQRGTGVVIAPRPQPQMHPHHFGAPLFLGGAWYPGYGYDVVQASPQVIVLQVPVPAPPVVKEEPKPIMPLMIELQDGQYVRSDRNEKPIQQAAVNTATKIKIADKQPAASPIVPAILIFRDGHREQVRDYAMVDGAIYAHGNYWTDGYWNKKILLSSLDVPATVSANQGTGANFELPSAPNVVLIHP